jgi:hypothetical protein
MDTDSAEANQMPEKPTKKNKRTKTGDNLRINITLYGQPATQAKELKQSGFVRNNADLLCQAISTLYQRFIDERLKVLRLKALEGNEEDERGI